VAYQRWLKAKIYKSDKLENWWEFSLNFLGNYEITSLIRSGNLKIEPFIPKLLSCNKLDLRISDDFVRLKNTMKVFGPKKKKDTSIFFHREKGSEFVIYPNERVLMCTIEHLRLPNNVIGLVGLRSSFSRLGLQTNMGIVDPGFSGQLTLEIFGSSFPVRFHAGDRVFHIIFAGCKLETVMTYAGKYKNQKGATLPKFENNGKPM